MLFVMDVTEEPWKHWVYEHNEKMSLSNEKCAAVTGFIEIEILTAEKFLFFLGASLFHVIANVFL